MKFREANLSVTINMGPGSNLYMSRGTTQYTAPVTNQSTCGKNSRATVQYTAPVTSQYACRSKTNFSKSNTQTTTHNTNRYAVRSFSESHYNQNNYPKTPFDRKISRSKVAPAQEEAYNYAHGGFSRMRVENFEPAKKIEKKNGLQGMGDLSFALTARNLFGKDTSTSPSFTRLSIDE